MATMIPIMYDLAAVILILLTVSYSSQKGFASTIVGLIGYVAAFFGANFVSKAGAQILYTTVFKQKVITFLQEQSLQSTELEELFSQLQKSIAELPKLINNIAGVVQFDEASISAAVGNSIQETVLGLEQTIIRPAITGFISMVLFVVLFFVFSLLVRSITKAVGYVSKMPLFSPVDRFLGGILGLVQSGIYLYLICVGFHFIFYFVGSMKYLNQSIILDTVILSRIYTFDPFAFL